MTTLSKLVFPIPSSLAISYSTPETEDLFDGNNLILQILPRDYKVLKPKNIRSTIEGLTSSIVEIIPQKYSFDAIVKDGREVIGKLLQELSDLATTDPFYYALVEVKDYVAPDSSDSDYTSRKGLLHYEINGGSYEDRDGERRFDEGYRIIFSEV
jgi:hypothetical protein